MLIKIMVRIRITITKIMLINQWIQDMINNTQIMSIMILIVISIPYYLVGDFADSIVRGSFVKKVYCLLTLELAVKYIFLNLVHFNDDCVSNVH